jgi:hypothetical protein
VRIVAAGDRISTPDFSIIVIVLVAAVVLLRTGAGGCDCRQLCVYASPLVNPSWLYLINLIEYQAICECFWLIMVLWRIYFLEL